MPNAQNNPIQAVLFDLDGTLFDTAPDLATSLNLVRKERALPPLPLEVIRPYTGQGSRSMIKLGFDIDEKHPDYLSIYESLVKFYQQGIAGATQLFAGIETVLHFLQHENLPWGIVTNKPTQLTQQLLQAIPLNPHPACIVCGDTLPKRKPHPEPIQHACQLLNISPADCLYVGDTEIDVIASKAAGMRSLVALYGYTAPDETPHTWAADGYVQSPLEIIEWLKLSRASG